GFMELYINGEKFINNELLTEPFYFTKIDESGYKYEEDILSFKTSLKIPNTQPMYCYGHMTYVVELFL
uniref:hypothetical protein n=1 Tax=Vibrio campbellii TaxID=680 RepID=UPI000B108C8D